MEKSLADRLLVTFLVEIGYFVFVVSIADAAARLAIPPSWLVVGLAVGMATIAVLLVPRRFAAHAPLVVRVVGVSFILGGLVSWLALPQERTRAVSIACLGLILATDVIGVKGKRAPPRA